MMENNVFQVKMYSDYKSPYAYMAFEPVLDLAKRYRVNVRWLPFQLRLKGKGQRSEFSEHKVKYSYMDARRWGNERGMWFKGPLKIYNTKPALIGGLFAEKKGLLRAYSNEAFRRFFMREFEADTPEATEGLLAELGLSKEEYREYLAGAGAEDYERIQDEAETDQCFGVPFMVFNGEPFWGYDRIFQLEEALKRAGLQREITGRETQNA
jgi:2-hydroxychromene-2-carboxylate isomerase